MGKKTRKKQVFHIQKIRRKVLILLLSIMSSDWKKSGGKVQGNNVKRTFAAKRRRMKGSGWVCVCEYDEE